MKGNREKRAYLMQKKKKKKKKKKKIKKLKSIDNQ